MSCWVADDLIKGPSAPRAVTVSLILTASQQTRDSSRNKGWLLVYCYESLNRRSFITANERRGSDAGQGPWRHRGALEKGVNMDHRPTHARTYCSIISSCRCKLTPSGLGEFTRYRASLWISGQDSISGSAGIDTLGELLDLPPRSNSTRIAFDIDAIILKGIPTIRVEWACDI